MERRSGRKKSISLSLSVTSQILFIQICRFVDRETDRQTDRLHSHRDGGTSQLQLSSASFFDDKSSYLKKINSAKTSKRCSSGIILIKNKKNVSRKYGRTCFNLLSTYLLHNFLDLTFLNLSGTPRVFQIISYGSRVARASNGRTNGRTTARKEERMYALKALSLSLSVLFIFA